MLQILSAVQVVVSNTDSRSSATDVTGRPDRIIVHTHASLPTIAERLTATDGPQTFWWMIGLPNAGKSTISNQIAGAHRIAIDEIRAVGGWRAHDRDDNKHAYRVARAQVTAALDSGCSVVFDSSGLHPEMRGWARTLADARGVPFVVLHLAVSEATSRMRDQVRRPLGDQGTGFFRYLADLAASIEPVLEAEDHPLVHRVPDALVLRLVTLVGGNAERLREPRAGQLPAEAIRRLASPAEFLP